MRPRAAIVLILCVLASAPLLWLIFSGGHSPSTHRTVLGAGQVAHHRAATRRLPRAVKLPGGRLGQSSCRARSLAAGLTDSPQRGAQYDQQFLDPFAPHPPVPRLGYYAPGRSPDPATLLHALYHSYVVVRYATGLARQAHDQLTPALKPLGDLEPIIVAGDHMPFAMGALAYGQTVLCSRMDATSIRALARWSWHAQRP